MFSLQSRKAKTVWEKCSKRKPLLHYNKQNEKHPKTFLFAESYGLRNNTTSHFNTLEINLYYYIVVHYMRVL